MRDQQNPRTVAARLRGWVSAHHWWGVAIATAATLALANTGIRDYCESQPRPDVCTPQPTPSDVMYLSLQLFIWESGDMFLGEAVPRTLHVARLAAPALLGYTAIGALLLLFADQFQMLRARLCRNHAIICGLGTHGLTLAAGFRAAGWRVVMLERDPRNPSLRAARVYGPVLAGSAVDPHALRRTGIRRARHLIAVCGTDAVNAEVAAQAAALVTSQRRVLTCHVHVASPVLWERLRTRELVSTREGASRLQFFNTLDATARRIASMAVSSSTSSEPGTPHVLLLGLGPVNERLVVHIVQAWRLMAADPPIRPRITIVDDAAADRARDLARRHPRLEQVCEVTARATAIGSDLGLHTALVAPDDPAVTIASVNATDDGTALAAGLMLAEQSPTQKFPIVVCATRARGLELLVADAGASANPRLKVVGILEQGCAPEFLLNGTNEILARAIHDEYVRSQARAGHTSRTNAAMQSWDALPESLRDSNRRQADHIVRKLDELSCTVTPLLDWDTHLVQFSTHEIEQLARSEHSRWVDERTAEGWRHAPGPKNIERKRSPYMIDWDLLPEAVKGIDRNTVAEIPTLLARVGLAIHRRAAAPADTSAPSYAKGTS